MANIIVSAGLPSTGLTVNAGDAVQVRLGGIANSTTVNSGGSLVVSNGGLALRGIEQTGATVVVSGGGIISGFNVSSGAVLSNGGAALATTLQGGTLLLSGPLATAVGTTGTGVFEVISGAAAILAPTVSNSFLAAGAGGILTNDILMNGNTIVALSGGTVVDATINLGGAGVVASGGTLNGGFIQSGGVLTVSSGGVLTGAETVTSGGTIVLNGTAGTGVINVRSGGSLVLSGTTPPANAIAIVSGSVLDLPDITRGSIVSVSNVPGALTLTLLNGAVVQLNTTGPTNYVLGTDLNGGVTISVCFAEGTMIATPDGERAVEDIRPGDLVCTLEGDRPVTWTGHRSLDVSTLARPDEGRLVRIRKDAFAENVPHRDLLVTPEHCVFWDGRLIPARMLVNGRTVLVDRTIDSYTYYHLELERHGVLIAEGLTAESYLDTGNRRNFANADAPALRPDLAVDAGHLAWATDAAAPLAVARTEVEPVWRMLADRAGGAAPGFLPGEDDLTENPDLHIVTGSGLRIRPLRGDGGRYSFLLPAGSDGLRLVSRTARPSDVAGPFVDDRRVLGVLVGPMTLWQGRRASTVNAHLSATELPGWSAREEGAHRWTQGDAVLPVDAGLMSLRPVLLDVTVLAAGPYLRASTPVDAGAVLRVA